MGRVVLITPSTAFETRVRAAVAGLPVGEVRRWREEYLRIDPTKIADEAVRHGAEVVCLGPGLPVATALLIAAALDQESPNVCVLLVAHPTPDLWREALRAGVRDVVTPDADAGELGRVFDRALETARRRARVTDDEATGRASRVVTVLSPKGGAGKTTVATNLAVGLAGAMPGQVAIVDLDVQFGDVAAALQLTPEHSLGDVASCQDDITPTMVKVFLSSHSSGLYALCAPESPAEGDVVTHEHGALAVRLLADEFGVVVVDTGAGLHEHALAAIELSTDLVVVCTTDVASVRSLRKELDALDRLGMTTQRRHFVLNRSDARVGLDLGDIEEAVGMKRTLTLPSSRAIPVSMNIGSPVIENEPRSPAARQLQKLVELFTEEGTDDDSQSPPAGSALAGILRRHAR